MYYYRAHQNGKTHNIMYSSLDLLCKSLIEVSELYYTYTGLLSCVFGVTGLNRCRFKENEYNGNTIAVKIYNANQPL